MNGTETLHDELRRIYRAVQETGSPADLRSLLEAAARPGAAADLGELGLFARLLDEHPYTVCPRWLIAFAAAWLRDRDHASILDPFGGTGSLIAGIAARLRPETAVAVCEDPETCGLARLLHPDSGVRWTEEPPAADRFDVVAGVAPFDAGRIVRALGRLRDGGAGIVLVTARDREEGDEEGVVAALTQAGVPLSAVLGVDGGVLLLTAAGPQDRILVGRLADDQSSRDILLKNIALRREGKAPALGVLVVPEAFRTVGEVLLVREIRDALHRIGGDVVPLGRVARELRTAPRAGGFAEREHAIYLPLGADLPVALSAHAIAGDERTYLQAVIDPALAHPAYLARFLERPAGLRIRALVLRLALRCDPVSAWREAPLPLPPAPVQDEVLRVQALLTHLKGRVEGLERELWDHPGAAAKIGRAAGEFSRGDDIEAWMETLPFPLASILWAYLTEKETERRIDHLFHFFEAFSEFVALIMLSALAPLLIRQQVDLLEENPYFRDAYRHATFRSWNVLGRRLARHTRELLGGKETHPVCLEAYGDPDPDFLEVITSKRLFAVLDEAADFRNMWKAHGGVAGAAEERHRSAQLDDCLARIRRITGTVFAPVTLLAPGSGRFHEGVYAYDAEALTGSHLTFPQVEVETIVPLDTERLYLLHERRRRPLELLPLVRMIESPCTPLRACYFYNRMDGDRIRWVSYHFEHLAELVRADPGIPELFASLRLIEEKGEDPR